MERMQECRQLVWRIWRESNTLMQIFIDSCWNILQDLYWTGMLSYKLAITVCMYFYWFIREAVADGFNKYDVTWIKIKVNNNNEDNIED
jgi:hypothetical protein